MRLSFCVSSHASLVTGSGALGSLLHTWLNLAHPLMWWWETWLTFTHCKAFWWTSNRRIISHCCKIPILKQYQGVSVYLFNIHLKLSVLGTVKNRRHRWASGESWGNHRSHSARRAVCQGSQHAESRGTTPHLVGSKGVAGNAATLKWPWAEDWGNE